LQDQRLACAYANVIPDKVQRSCIPRCSEAASADPVSSIGFAEGDKIIVQKTFCAGFPIA
jgi:hypothetical protein